MKKIVSIILACLVLACVICAAGCTMTSSSTTTTTHTDADGTVHTVTDSTETVNGQTTHSHSEVVSSGEVTKDTAFEQGGVKVELISQTRGEGNTVVVVCKAMNDSGKPVTGLTYDVAVLNANGDIIGKCVTDPITVKEGMEDTMTATIKIAEPFTNQDAVNAKVGVRYDK